MFQTIWTSTQIIHLFEERQTGILLYKLEEDAVYVLLLTNIGSKVGRKYLTVMEQLEDFSNLKNCDIAMYVRDVLDGYGILL